MAFASHWLFRTLRWSNSRQSYIERGVALLLLAGGGLLVLYRHRLDAATQVVLWAALLLGAAVFLRRGWIKLFGPVLFYDMIRAARRGRYFVMRFLYAAIIFFVLLAVFVNGRGTAFDDSRAAEAFFNAFLAVQLIAVSLLTPAYVAGAVSEEKERKTLEFLLATDLRNREIVLSKLLSRLANLTLFLLTGLPILSMVQFLGGVDPTLVMVGFAITYLTMLGVGGLSILFSTLLRKSRDAIALTYLATVAYLMLSLWSLALPHDWATIEVIPTASPWRVGDLIDCFNEGNLALLYFRFQEEIWRGVPPEELWQMIRGFALFHGTLLVVCIVWAVLRLRAVALKESQSRVKRRRGLGLFRRAKVGARPMVWKEVHIDGRFRLTWIGWIIVLIVLAATVVPGLFLFFEFLVRFVPPFGLGVANPNWDHAWSGQSDWWYFHQRVNVWVRTAGTAVAAIALAAVAIRAAGSISGERERQTLDGLLASPLGSGDIVFGKWVGSVLCVRWVWLWLGVIWGMGLFMGGLSPLALPLLMAAWLAYAGAFAQVGLFFSMASRSSMRATVWTILVLLGVCFGHWLPWMCCAFGAMWMGPGSGIEEIVRFQAGMTPPVAMAILAFFHGDHSDPFGGNSGNNEFYRMMFHCILGMVLWAAAALFLSVSNQRYFRIKMNRDGDWLTTARRGVAPPAPRLAETPLADDAGTPTKPVGAVLLDESWEKSPAADKIRGEDGSRVVLLDETWEDPREPRGEDEDSGKRP